MEANNEPQKLNTEDCTIGLAADGEVAIITMPIKRYALDKTNGNALIYGKCREIQAHVLQMAAAIRLEQEKAGILKVNGKLPPDLKVH